MARSVQSGNLYNPPSTVDVHLYPWRIWHIKYGYLPWQSGSTPDLQSLSTKIHSEYPRISSGRCLAPTIKFWKQPFCFLWCLKIYQNICLHTNCSENNAIKEIWHPIYVFQKDFFFTKYNLNSDFLWVLMLCCLLNAAMPRITKYTHKNLNDSTKCLYLNKSSFN